jgi:hypothetical protein
MNDEGDDEFGDEFQGNADLADTYDQMKGKGGADSEGDINEDMDFGVGQVQNEEQEMIQQ